MAVIKFHDKHTREKIGLKYILDRLEIKTVYGLNHLQNIRPFNRDEFYELEREFIHLNEAIQFILTNDKLCRELFKEFSRFRDITSTLNRISEGNTLDDIEFFELKSFALTIEILINLYDKTGLNLDIIKFSSLNEVIKLLNPYVKIVPSFYVHDTYSNSLREVREQKKVLESMIITINDFCEGDNLKQKRSEIVIKEREEERKVREMLTSELINFKQIFIENTESIGKLEFLLAKARISLMYPSCFPVLNRDDNSTLKISEAVNPMVMDSLRLRRRPFTPISLEVEKGITIITGANMCGKTIGLSTIVLNTSLVMIGFLPYAKYFEMPIFDFVSFISGDLQDVSQALSSFGAELVKLKHVSKTLSKGIGLVVFDEFARSTNPYEGAKFVKSLCKYIMNKGSYGILATHYDGIEIQDANYYQVVGLKNLSFDSIKDEIEITTANAIEELSNNIDYNLVRVSSYEEVPKDAIRIAKLLDVGDEFISILNEMYDK